MGYGAEFTPRVFLSLPRFWRLRLRDVVSRRVRHVCMVFEERHIFRVALRWKRLCVHPLRLICTSVILTESPF